MREIKFRAFNKSEKKMCRVVSTDFEDMVTVRFPEFEGEEYYDDYNEDMELNEFEPLMQFTGLKDRNGVEIYEGDILKDSGEEGPVIVEWSNEICGFLFVDIFDYKGREEYRADQICYEVFEVIGNIYEHPHLLKGE